MVAMAADGQPAFVAFQRTDDTGFRPHAVHVLAVAANGVSHISVFLEPAICALFTSASPDGPLLRWLRRRSGSRNMINRSAASSLLPVT